MESQQQQQQQQALQDEYDALTAAITKLGSQIRELKKKNESSSVTTANTELDVAIQSLQQLKITAAAKQASLTELQQQSSSPFSRKLFDDLIVRKMFIVPSFEIHGGVKGLFDLGPPACALKVTATIDCWFECH
jgi:glycyl-tRNA synthetase